MELGSREGSLGNLAMELSLLELDLDSLAKELGLLKIGLMCLGACLFGDKFWKITLGPQP